ncbi:endonuclease/exonuclease/phosphatase family protein [Sphingomonas sp. HT-1]|uniref:endonuclease/exonuclease/phosphatase family protein n=1 Tax=unclassified Sphingomonas TaxID=196159 RepID=UPI0002FBCD77|nr:MULTISPECIES: endonuclease/exonuclease/phosphatase family protein [unclassified Sphingomonas]KTF68827.1 hypothetical protein ATB93_12145 [Sphingomonas sp. WG]
MFRLQAVGAAPRPGVGERLRQGFGLVLASLAGLGIGFGLLGTVWEPGDAANIVAPAWPLLALGAALCLAARHRRAALGIATLGVGYAAVTLLPGLAAAPQAMTEDPVRDLRIVQFNAWKHNPVPQQAARWILAQRPDIVVLAEVGWQSALLQSLLPHFAGRVNCAPGGRCSTWILSRLPIRAARSLAQGDPENRRALSAAWARLETSCGDLDVIGIHLARPWPYAGQRRNLARLRAEIAHLPREQMLIAGDFNLPAWQFGMRRLEAEWAPMRRVTQLRVTWPARLHDVAVQPFLPLDHLFLGPRWQVVAVHRGPANGSDHLPVVTTIRPRSSCAIPVTVQ